jgi:hypothetical protein
MKTSEPEIRDALLRRAEMFEMPVGPPRDVRAAIRRRRSRNGVVVGLGSATVAAIVAASVLLGTSTGSGAPAGSQPGGTGRVAAMSYVLLDSKVGTESSPPSWLSDHIACMREEGFDIPDPAQTSDGWSIIVDDPAAAGMGTPAWREAAFVTCAPDRPLSGNFILGFPKDKVDAFVACMTGEGYDLPEPTTNADGEYVFDLTNTNIDTASSAWDEAVFVTCSLD